jgi:nicotinate phosphoribosyltransferase
MGIDHSKKMIIFSDAVDVEKALKLKAQCEKEGFMCKLTLRHTASLSDAHSHAGSFGIGTSLTNDFRKASTGGKEKSKALNMVIKLGSVNGTECVKISDERGKHTGHADAVKFVKEFYHIA